MSWLTALGVVGKKVGMEALKGGAFVGGAYGASKLIEYIDGGGETKAVPVTEGTYNSDIMFREADGTLSNGTVLKVDGDDILWEDVDGNIWEATLSQLEVVK